MMPATTVSPAVSVLNYVKQSFGRYFAVVCFLFGGVGAILNVIILTRRSLRSNPCSICFLASTFADLFIVFISIPVRFLTAGYNIDPTLLSVATCRIQYYTFWLSRALSSWYIALASIDRYLSSSISARIRRWSSKQIAYLTIAVVTTTISLSYIHVLIYFTINVTRDKYGNVTSFSCNGENGFYRTFAAFFHLTCYTIIPPLLMLVFGLLTLNNIRQQSHLVLPSTQTRATTKFANKQNRKTDRQLFLMLFLQVICIFLSTTPLSAQQLYSTLTASFVKDAFKMAQDSLFLAVVGNIAFIAHCSPFYLFTLAGAIFRRELKNLFFKFVYRCFKKEYHGSGSTTLQKPITRTTQF
ncbi:unnamed protein product [Didymodactylos carnosus]|uniref:G-protein coupled receptors family 1 profile domain-containing protein n=1 Tax=Didymodactylos carnosus TaxID=1234261 RepID=A0A815KYZ1_9BILA|nr:unnamed protein product [Didymodactylos carnosus]CAF1396273.1 unnamed protein product [Didymodactylos carnosus]CAF3927816.1 unnamed protein product [Didymodactylos carnosus]CAF4290453.1 unnamed protein product [Didymodactylos carnosus]